MSQKKTLKPSLNQLFLRDDASGATEGKWFPHLKGTKFRIVSLLNPEYQAELTGVISKFDSASARESDEFSAAVHKLMAKHIVTGWQGIYDEEGQELPFSSQAVFDLLKSSADFRDFVTKKASNSAAFLDDAEQDLKN